MTKGWVVVMVFGDGRVVTRCMDGWTGGPVERARAEESRGTGQRDGCRDGDQGAHGCESRDGGMERVRWKGKEWGGRRDGDGGLDGRTEAGWDGAGVCGKGWSWGVRTQPGQTDRLRGCGGGGVDLTSCLDSWGHTHLPAAAALHWGVWRESQ